MGTIILLSSVTEVMCNHIFFSPFCPMLRREGRVGVNSVLVSRGEGEGNSAQHLQKPN